MNLKKLVKEHFTLMVCYCIIIMISTMILLGFHIMLIIIITLTVVFTYCTIYALILHRKID